MLEGLQRHAADGALLHGGEHRIAQFGEAGGGEAQQAVGDDQRRGDDDERGALGGERASTLRE